MDADAYPSMSERFGASATQREIDDLQREIVLFGYEKKMDTNGGIVVRILKLEKLSYYLKYLIFLVLKSI